MAISKTQVSELYVALVGRASEGEGNTYWQSFDSVESAAAQMLLSPATAEYFGTALDSDQAFIEHIYLNTANKTATDDPEGIAHWVTQLQTMSRAQVIEQMVYSMNRIQAEIEAGSTAYDTATVAAAQQFTNRVAVSDYTADTLETIAVEDIDSTLSFSSALTVTDDAATVTAAKEAVDAQVPVDGETFMLTTDSDDVINGTDASDLITAAQGTLQGGDIILDNSTTDNDLFQATVTSTTTEPRIQNIERVEITGEYVGTGLNLGLSSNIQTLTLDTKIANGTASVLGANSLNAAKIVAGDNIKTLNVSSLASGTRDAVEVDANNAEAVNLNGSGSPDVYNVTLAKDATLKLGLAAATDTLNSAGDIVTVTVAGDATINAAVTADNAELDLNIVANTEASEITLSDASNINAEKMAISGSKDVTIKVTDGVAVAGNFTANAADYDGTAITSTSTGTVTLDISALQASASITTDNDFSQAKVDVVELSGAAAGASTITLNDASKLHLTANVNKTLSLGLDNGDKDTAYTAGSLVIDVSETQKAAAAMTTTATVETLLVSAKADKVTDTDIDENGTHETAITIASITLDKDTTAMVINGDENITLSSITTDDATAEQTITAASLTGDLTISTMAGDDATIIGGKGKDNITTNVAKVFDIQTGEGNDTVNVGTYLGKTAAAAGTKVDTGAGNDTVYSSTNIATIKLGSGDDTVTTAGKDTITLGAGSDTVKLGQNAASISVEVTDFVKGTDVIEIVGGATAALDAIDLTDMIVTDGLYTTAADKAEAGAAGEWSITLKNDGTALSATDMSDSFRLKDVILKEGSTNKLGDLNDSVKVAGASGTVATTNAAGDYTAKITTGTGSDTVSIAAGNTFDASGDVIVNTIVKDFTVGEDKIILTGAVAADVGTVNLKNVDSTNGVYSVGISGTDTTKGHTFKLENDGSNIVTEGDLTGIVQLGSATTAFSNTIASAPTTITGGNFDDFVSLIGSSATNKVTYNFSNNGGVDTITIAGATAGFELLNFNNLTGIDTSAGATSKVDLAANAAKVSDAKDGAVYIFADSADGAGASKITTLVEDTNNGYTQAVIDDEVAAFINAGLGVSAGETYVVIINDNSSTAYGAEDYGTGAATHNAYAYLVTGDADGVQADNIELIGQLTDSNAGTIAAENIA